MTVSSPRTPSTGARVLAGLVWGAKFGLFYAILIGVVRAVAGPFTSRTGRVTPDEHLVRLVVAMFQGITLVGGIVSWLKPQLTDLGRCVAVGIIVGLVVGMIAGLTLESQFIFAAPFAFGGAIAGGAMGNFILWHHAQRGAEWRWPF